MVNRIIVYWGTGEVSNNIVCQNILLSPSFYIDNSIEKSGKYFHGKIIRHPSQVDDWKKYYVIVATDYFKDIAKQLRGYGLKEKEDFLYYKDTSNNINEERLVSEVFRFVEEMEEKKCEYQNRIIIFADFISYDRGICNFVNQWDKKAGGHRLLLFSEATWLSMEVTKSKMEVDTLILPQMFGKNRYLKKSDKVIDFESAEAHMGYKKERKGRFKEECEEKDYLKWSAENLRLRHNDMEKNYEYLFCHYTVFLVERILDELRPRKVILWNAFQAFHHIIRNLCNKHGIEVAYMEFGNIPGTVFVESYGQMGESFPACETEKFMSISVMDDDIEAAGKIRKFLKETELNRNIQPDKGIVEELRKKMNKGRPVIFYAGQNDFESGMQPYCENARKYHSPVFTGSYDAAEYLSEICEKNDWNFIFKPHPVMNMFTGDYGKKLKGTTIVVEKANINELVDFADVTVTILSTVCYISLIRERPTLLLGCTQLRDKGCTYQAFDKNNIEAELRRALAEGFTESQKRAFEKHMIQLIKYCSYYDLQIRNVKYGKELDDIIS